MAQQRRVPLIDINLISSAAVQALGQVGADELAMAPPPAPGQPASGASAGFDRTHVGVKGACVFAALAARELARQVPALSAAVHAGDDCAALPPPPATAPQRSSRATDLLPGSLFR